MDRNLLGLVVMTAMIMAPAKVDFLAQAVITAPTLAQARTM